MCLLTRDVHLGIRIRSLQIEEDTVSTFNGFFARAYVYVIILFISKAIGDYFADCHMLHSVP